MAVAAVPVKNASTVFGNKRIKVYDLNFSGSYATGGETVTASSVGLRKIDFVNVQGHVAEGSTPTTGNNVAVAISATGTSAAVRLYELGGGGLAGDPLQEKGAEAYITGQTCRAQFIGY